MYTSALWIIKMTFYNSWNKMIKCIVHGTDNYKCKNTFANSIWNTSIIEEKKCHVWKLKNIDMLGFKFKY